MEWVLVSLWLFCPASCEAQPLYARNLHVRQEAIAEFENERACTDAEKWARYKFVTWYLEKKIPASDLADMYWNSRFEAMRRHYPNYIRVRCVKK